MEIPAKRSVCNLAEEWVAFVLVRNLLLPLRPSAAGPPDLVFDKFKIWDVPQGDWQRLDTARQLFPEAAPPVHFNDCVYERRYTSIPPPRQASPSDFGSIPEDVEDALLLLRLFKTGDLAFAQLKVKKRNGSLDPQFPYRLISNATPAGSYYRMGPEECANWDTFASDLVRQSAWHATWFGVARRFFLYGGAKEFNCHKEPGTEINEVDRIVDYMIAIEATLAPEKDVFIGKRLRERAVKLLGEEGEQADQTRELLKKFYDLRSTVAHGSPLNESDREFITKNKEGFEYTVRKLLIKGLRELPSADKDRIQLLANWWAPSDADRAGKLLEDFGRIKNHGEKESLIKRLQVRVAGEG
jgi:hypothetical protein